MRELRLVFRCATLFSAAFTTLVLAQSSSVIGPARAPANAAVLSEPTAATQAKVVENYGKLPLSFEANQGQTDARVKFLSRTSAYSLFLTADEAVLALRGKKENTHRVNRKMANAANKEGAGIASPQVGGVLRMKLRNARVAARVTGVDELAGTNNYFIGNDPAKWRTNVPTYAKVKYEGIYSGIDLVYYGNQRQLEYDFIVAPGADPRRIAFDVKGAKRIRQDAHGELVFKVGEDEIRWHQPVVYQEKDGERQLIAARYAITETDRVTFELATYDASRPLYIDPLIYSTYLGGSSQDSGQGIGIDSAGNAYITGYTRSTDFPTMNALQPVYGGGPSSFDAFVAKLNPTGSALVYSTYLGGSDADYGNGIAADSTGNAYVTGLTASANFPVTPGAFQTTCANASSCASAFVAKINPLGSALVYSTYLGGTGGDYATGIAADSAGNAYVTGTTGSGFPTMNPLQPNYGGNEDAFVTKINPSGSALVYSTIWVAAGMTLALPLRWTVRAELMSLVGPFQPTFRSRIRCSQPSAVKATPS